jgi:hypothetical protein
MRQSPLANVVAITPRLARAAVLVCFCAPAILLGGRPATAAAPPLDLYTIMADEPTLTALEEQGYELVNVRKTAMGLEAQIVLDPDTVVDLSSAGLQPELWRDADGLTFNQQANRQLQEGYTVWRSYDEPGGIRDEIEALAAQRSDIVKLVPIGTSVEDRTILALKVTADANITPDGSRPAVLYSSMQHAREWISVEVTRRLLHHLINEYDTDSEVQTLLQNTEAWFVIVANPDGYQFTFTENRRMWRKNMRDNNGDGQIGVGDGVDLNRNFDTHWNYDSLGSSGNPASDTYRGTEPASEPETIAMQNLLTRVPFAFQVNYHSYANLLLYPMGWQESTPSVDDPIFQALSGTRDKPAIPNFVPMVSAGLYITNGETCDYSYATHGTLCWTPELSDGGSGQGFAFPDDEDIVAQEFVDNLPFAMDILRSAQTPASPVSHLGNEVPQMVVRPFQFSYGSPQLVEVNAARTLGDVRLVYRINDSAPVTAATEEWSGGERYGVEGSAHFHVLRGEVTGALPGDSVTVWFEAVDSATDSARGYHCAVHLRADRAFESTGARRGGRRLHWQRTCLLQARRTDISAHLPRGASRHRRDSRRVRRRCPRAYSPIRTWCARALRRGDLVHRRRFRHSGARYG